MTTSEQTLLALVRASLFSIPFSVTDDVDWDEVFRESQEQSVTSLLAENVPEQFRAQWSTASYNSIAKYVRVLHSQGEINRLFAEAKIGIAILKGASAAIYYPEPSHRAMGDVDFLVPQDQFDRSVALMLQNGYHITHREDDTNARHIGFSKNNISFELHYHFSYDDCNIEKYLIDGLNHTEEARIEGFSFPMLPALPNGLVLLSHMSHHLKSGMGLRQIIDWMMYVDSVLDDSFWKSRFEDAAKSVGLDTLARTVTRMCIIYLGLEDKFFWVQNVDDSLCQRLMENVLSSGNFGRKQGQGNNVETVLTAVKSKGLFHYLQHAGEYNWKAYKNHHWLKPFVGYISCFGMLARAFNQNEAGSCFRMLREVTRDTTCLEN